MGAAPPVLVSSVARPSSTRGASTVQVSTWPIAWRAETPCAHFTWLAGDLEAVAKTRAQLILAIPDQEAQEGQAQRARAKSRWRGIGSRWMRALHVQPGRDDRLEPGSRSRESRFPDTREEFPVQRKNFPVPMRREFIPNCPNRQWNSGGDELSKLRIRKNSLYFPCISGNRPGRRVRPRLPPPPPRLWV